MTQNLLFNLVELLNLQKGNQLNLTLHWKQESQLIRIFRMIWNDFALLRNAALKSFSFRFSQNVIIVLTAIPPITSASAFKTLLKRHQHPTKLWLRLMHFLVIGFLLFAFAMGKWEQGQWYVNIDKEVLKTHCLLMALTVRSDSFF